MFANAKLFFTKTASGSFFLQLPSSLTSFALGDNKSMPQKSSYVLLWIV